jgi:hypothetical protein
MAQVQQIYARLFTHIDVATSLLLKQDLVDAEFAYCSIIRQDASSRRAARGLAADGCAQVSTQSASIPIELRRNAAET